MIIDSCFSSKWYDLTDEKSPLSVVLDIEKLYEKITENLMTTKISKNIPLKEKETKKNSSIKKSNLTLY